MLFTPIWHLFLAAGGKLGQLVHFQRAAPPKLPHFLKKTWWRENPRIAQTYSPCKKPVSVKFAESRAGCGWFDGQITWLWRCSRSGSSTPYPVLFPLSRPLQYFGTGLVFLWFCCAEFEKYEEKKRKVAVPLRLCPAMYHLRLCFSASSSPCRISFVATLTRRVTSAPCKKLCQAINLSL